MHFERINGVDSKAKANWIPLYIGILKATRMDPENVAMHSCGISEGRKEIWDIDTSCVNHKLQIPIEKTQKNAKSKR